MASAAPTSEPTTLPFREHACEVISRLRGAVSDLLEPLPADLADGPTRFARSLKVDTKLAWKIIHLLEERDLFEAGRFVPGTAAFRRFLQAASRHRLPAELMRAARNASAEFEALVKLHAGDRRSFDLMLAGQTEGDQLRPEMEQRKAAYHSNSFLWGVQAKAQIKTAIITPSADPDRFDAALINGFIGLRRIRAHVPWRITSTYSVDDFGVVRAELAREPLDPDGVAGTGGITAPLLTRFCTQPLPKLEPVTQRDGAVDFGLAQGPLGRRASETCLIGEVVRAAEPRYQQPGFEYNAIYVRMRTPCEVLVLDVLVDQELFDPATYRARLFSDLFTGQLLTQHLDCDALALHEKVEHLGAGLNSAHLSFMPRYREMLQYVFERTGWPAGRFHVHRIRIEYPITPTSLILRHRLPEKPRAPVA
ncbi:MAG: hypothetical protein V2A76_09365 [Planctomycetota bacterium]